ncbi:MAG: NIPSNAP family protein [Acidobacteriaceae bacterium]|nr:NIPSNAP family protein [Acidobacteriaceae bacterium]
MITLCIQYEIDHHKLADFERYARNWPEPIRRCGGELIGYFLPTKLAGSTNAALALIRFKDLTAYERYREALMNDPDAIANGKHADASGCILVENRAFLRQIPE